MPAKSNKQKKAAEAKRKESKDNFKNNPKDKQQKDFAKKKKR